MQHSNTLEMDDWEDVSVRLPEHNLLIALLNRALLDYLGTQADERAAAREWLFAETEDQDEDLFSYGWVCSQLGIEPAYLLDGVETMRIESGGKVKRWYLQRGKSDDQMAA